MADLIALSPTTAAAQAAPRIKRNTVCLRTIFFSYVPLPLFACIPSSFGAERQRCNTKISKKYSERKTDVSRVDRRVSIAETVVSRPLKTRLWLSPNHRQHLNVGADSLNDEPLHWLAPRMGLSWAPHFLASSSSVGSPTSNLYRPPRLVVSKVNNLCRGEVQCQPESKLAMCAMYEAAAPMCCRQDTQESQPEKVGACHSDCLSRMLSYVLFFLCNFFCKLTSYRSKLEELQQEVRSIKEAVGKSTAPPPIFTRTLPPINSRDGILSQTLPPMRPFDTPILLPPVLTPSVTTTPTPKTIISSIGSRAAEPRALKSRAFSGDDINFYFDKCVEPSMLICAFFPVASL